jgi:membrane fusion protein, multidrug efflux system
MVFMLFHTFSRTFCSLPRNPLRTAARALLSGGTRPLLAVFFLCFLFSCKGPVSENQAEPHGASVERDESVPVKTVVPQLGDIALSLNATTSIQARNQADVYARSIGFCEKIFVEEGDPVEKGDLLAKLGDQEIRLALEQSAARLGKVEKDAERAQTLFAEGLISKQMNQDLSLQWSLARADRELARKRLEDTSIVAPIPGTVIRRSVKVGDLVTTTQPLFRIEDLHQLEAEVHIPEQDFLKVRPGQESELTADAFPGHSFGGTVERVNPVIDPQSGTAKATIAIENPQGLLRPGMFIRVRIVTEVHRDTWILPKQAILIQGERKAVYVVRDGKAQEVFVRTGFQDADRVEILDGLNPGERVIVMGHLGLQGDTKVRVIE